MKQLSLMMLGCTIGMGMITGVLFSLGQHALALFGAFATGGMVSNLVLKNLVDQTFESLNRAERYNRSLLLENETLKTDLGAR